MNANQIRVKSSRISPVSLLTWTEFREKDVSFIVLSGIVSYELIKQQLRVQKPSVCIVADVRHFFRALSFIPFKRVLAVIMIIQLSKNIRFMRVCVETKSAKTIRA